MDLIEILRNEILMKKHTYGEAASGSRINLKRFEKLMDGRLDMTVEEGEKLCKFLGIPLYVVLLLVEKEREWRRAVLAAKNIALDHQSKSPIVMTDGEALSDNRVSVTRGKPSPSMNSSMR